MIRLASCAAALLLLFSVDNTRVLPWRPDVAPSPDILAGAKLPLLPDFGSAPDPQVGQAGQSGQSQTSTGTQSQSKSQTQDVRNVQSQTGTEPLSQPSELALVRFVDGEYAHVVKSLPVGKDGFIIHPNKPFDEQMLHRQLTSHGAAVNPGDQVQITGLKFRKDRVYVLINGGGRTGTSLKDRITYGISGIPTATMTPNNNGPDQTAVAGTTLILDFDGPIPDMTPDQLKAVLAPVLDFSHERSAAILWSQTLPPDMQKAITERRAVLGMSREMVEAAIGKPDRKVRDKDENGNEREDWIYGQPPAITLFVTFIGDKVVRVEQFPRDHGAAN
jgi:hypothetical protein